VNSEFEPKLKTLTTVRRPTDYIFKVMRSKGRLYVFMCVIAVTAEVYILTVCHRGALIIYKYVEVNTV